MASHVTSRKLRRRLAAAFSVACAANGLAAGSSPVSAAEHPQFDCQIRNHIYAFPQTGLPALGIPMNAGQQADFMAGANAWTAVMEQDRSTLMTVSQNPNTANIDVWAQDLGSTWGRAICAYDGNFRRSILMDDGLAAGALYQHVAAHEAGHLHGFRHPGDDDNQPGTTGGTAQVMATCTAQGLSTSVTKDDRSSAMKQWGSNPYSTYTSNPSFEYGLTDWTVDYPASTIFNLRTANGSIGPFNATLSGANVATQNMTRVQRLGGRTVRAEGRFKDLDAGYQSQYRLEVYSRSVSYATIPPDACTGGGTPWAGSLNYNAPNSVGSMVLRADSGYRSSADAWEIVSTPSFVVPAGDATDISVRVWKGSTGMNLHMDNVGIVRMSGL